MCACAEPFVAAQAASHDIKQAAYVACPRIRSALMVFKLAARILPEPLVVVWVHCPTSSLSMQSGT